MHVLYFYMFARGVPESLNINLTNRYKRLGVDAKEI